MPRLAVSPLLRALDRHDATTHDWLVGVARAVRALFRDGSGFAVYNLELTRAEPRWQVRVLSCTEDLGLSLPRYSAQIGDKELSELFQPVARVGSSWQALAPNAQLLELLREDLARLQCSSIFYVMATEGSHSMCMLFPHTLSALSGIQHKLMLGVAEQIRISLRFRARLSQESSVVPNWDGCSPRAQLRALVREREREHGTADSCVVNDAARTNWAGVAGGAWSIADVYEEEGRHHLIVFQTPSGLRSARALTARELSIVTHVCEGTSNKAIAIELGVSETEISKGFSRALAKLGLSSRQDLVRAKTLLERDQDLERSGS